MPKVGIYDSSTVDELLNNNRIKLLEPYKGAKSHHNMQCIVCDHIWSATPLSKKQTFRKYGVSGCPQCNTSRRNAQYDVIRQKRLEELQARGIVINTEGYDGRLRLDYNGLMKDEKISVTNTNCGHTFLVSPGNLIQAEVECGVCGPYKRVANATKWSKANSATWKETAEDWLVYKAEVTALTRIAYEAHKQYINPTNLPRNKAGVEGAYHLDHIVSIRFCFDNKIPCEVCAHPSNLQMLFWRENIGSRDNLKGAIPPIFQQYIGSTDRMQHYIDSLINRVFPKAIPYHCINGTMTSLYDEASNTAIIIIPIDSMYADSKVASISLKALQTIGVRGIIIFEDELVKLDLIVSKLKHYSATNDIIRIHARQCEIRTVTPKQKKQLLIANHTQGNDASKIMYGAFYNDKLVAVMTFCAPRVALGAKNKDRSVYTGVWELSRFCIDTSMRIPGIASKLLTHFIKNNNWIQIYSYADRRWSVGNLYTTLGFVQESVSKPDYQYVIDGLRKHRWNYRKDMLQESLENYNPELTEYQNMVNHGFYRVWDCGTIKFVMNK